MTNKLVFILDKGRKASAVGTEKISGGIVWRKDASGKWKYVRMATPKERSGGLQGGATGGSGGSGMGPSTPGTPPAQPEPTSTATGGSDGGTGGKEPQKQPSGGVSGGSGGQKRGRKPKRAATGQQQPTAGEEPGKGKFTAGVGEDLEGQENLLKQLNDNTPLALQPISFVKDQSAQSKLVSKMKIGGMIEVIGKTGQFTILKKHRDSMLTIQSLDGKTKYKIVPSDIAKIVPKRTARAVTAAIQAADPNNRAAMSAQINGVDLSKTPKMDYQFTPKDTKISSRSAMGAGRNQTDFDAKDYSEAIALNVNLVPAKGILDKSRPSFIPEIDDSTFGGGMLCRVEGVKTGEDRFVIYTGTRQSVAIVNGAVLAATQDYYMKRQRALYQKKMEDARTSLVNTIPVLEQKTKDASDAMNANPDPNKKWKFEYDLKRVSDQLKLAKEIQGAKKLDAKWGKRMGIRPPKMVGTNKATHSHMAMIRALDLEYAQTHDPWKSHRAFIGDLTQKTLDAEAQFEDDLGVYSKGEETSFGDKNAASDLLDSHGVRVKRQNGAGITKQEINDVKTALDKVYKYFGNRSSMAKAWGLKISHSGDVGMHARKAAGLFFPSFHAIGVSFGGGGGMTLAHEFGHFMDYWTGGKTGYHYSSDNWNSTAGQIAQIIRKKTPGGLKGYWGRTCETFARSVEAYFAEKEFNENRTDPNAQLSKPPHYEYMPPMDVMRKEVFPLIDKYLDENKDILKSMKVGLVVLSKSKHKAEIRKLRLW